MCFVNSGNLLFVIQAKLSIPSVTPDYFKNQCWLTEKGGVYYLKNKYTKAVTAHAKADLRPHILVIDICSIMQLCTCSIRYG